MSGGVIVETFVAPTTQTVAGVVSLLKYLNKPFDPLPQEVKLPGAVLVLSNKRDCYYVTGPKNCSCPARTYRPGQSCKHMRKHFPQTVKSQTMAAALEPVDSIRPTGKWHGHNGPVEPEENRPKTLLEEMKAEGYEMSFEPDD